MGVAVIFGWGFLNRNYLGWERFTVIKSVGDDIHVLSIDSGKGIRVVVPADLMIQTVQGRGEWRVGALAALGKKYGREWEADSIANALGIFYTGWYDNLGIVDRFVWWQKSREVDFFELRLSESAFVDEVVQADGVKVWKLNDAWKKRSTELFSSENIATSDIEAEVINTTKKSGLGSKAAAALTSSGVRVIRVGEQESEREDRCVILGSQSELGSKLGRYVQRYMGCKTSASGEEDAKLSVLVGLKYFEWALGD